MIQIWFLIFVFLMSPVFAAKTFVVCTEGSPSSFGPQLFSDSTSSDAASPMFNRLLEFKNGETNLEPVLAESWTVSKNGLEYTFKLRKNVQFHNNSIFTPSRPMNADDVLFSFQRMSDNKHAYHKVSGGKYVMYEAMGMDEMVKTVKKMDDHTVKYILRKPLAIFLPTLAMEFNSILSKEYADQLAKKGKKEWIDQKPIGTGPFRFKRYAKDALVRYEAHPKYFKGKVKLDGMVFAITPDPSVRSQKLRAGECHFVTNPAPSDFAALKKDPKVKLVSAEGLNVGYLALNTQKKPFDQVKVRRAIHHALNRKAYIKAIYLDQAVLAKNPIPPTLWSYNEKTKDLGYDPEKAKKLLAEAGLKKGFSTDLWAIPVARAYNPNGKKMAEMMQADLAKVGIKATVVSYDWPTYLTKVKAGEHTMAQLGWMSDNGDPDNFLRYKLSCASIATGENRSKWCDPEYDKLVTEAGRITDQAKRGDLYKKAQSRFKSQVPWVPIAHAKTYKAISKKVKGYRIHPLNSGNNFEYVDLE